MNVCGKIVLAVAGVALLLFACLQLWFYFINKNE